MFFRPFLYRKIYIKVPKTQHNIFNKTMCKQTVHVTAYKATVC